MEAGANTELYPLPEDAKVPFLDPDPALTDERDPTLDGLIERPYKDSVKQGVRIHSLVCLPAEVQWVNEANDKKLYLELSSIIQGLLQCTCASTRSVLPSAESCKLALKTLFWSALRDKHRAVAGEWNFESQAVRDAVDSVIDEFGGASYEVPHGDRSTEISLNCGGRKSAVEEGALDE